MSKNNPSLCCGIKAVSFGCDISRVNNERVIPVKKPKQLLELNSKTGFTPSEIEDAEFYGIVNKCLRKG